jgi:hypothetical protein
MITQGTPEEMRPALGLDPRVAANPESYTGQYLKQVFERQRGGKAKRAAHCSGCGVKMALLEK